MGGCYNAANTRATIIVPYVVFYEISGIPEYGISGYLGSTRHRFQIDVFARSPEEAKAISMGAIKDAIEASGLNADMILHMSGAYSPLDKTYQYTTEYYIWAAE